MAVADAWRAKLARLFWAMYDACLAASSWLATAELAWSAEPWAMFLKPENGIKSEHWVLRAFVKIKKALTDLIILKIYNGFWKFEFYWIFDFFWKLKIR